MSWEIFEKVVQRSTSPTITISKGGRINFNGASAKVLAENAVEHVILMWDKENRSVGVRRVGKRDFRSYTVHFAKKNVWAGFAAKTFLTHIGYDYSKTTSFPTEWNETESMFVFSLPTSSNEESVPVAASKLAFRKPGETGGHKASASA